MHFSLCADTTIGVSTDVTWTTEQSISSSSRIKNFLRVFQTDSGPHPQEVKQPGREAQLEKTWIYASTLSYDFMT